MGRETFFPRENPLGGKIVPPRNNLRRSPKKSPPRNNSVKEAKHAHVKTTRYQIPEVPLQYHNKTQAMTIDRHQAITKPLHFQTESSARRMVALSWLLAFVVAIPQLLIFVEEERRSKTGAVKRVCVSQGYTAEWQRQAYVTWLALYVLVAPTIIISYCYIRIVWTLWHTESTCPTGQNYSRTRTDTISKAKIKTIKMTVCIIIGFVTCWTPYFVVTLHDVYTGKSLPDVAYVIAETMALFNSAFNPIVYGLFSVKTKRGVREVCCCQDSARSHSTFSSSVTPRTDLESVADGNSPYRLHAVSTRNRQTNGNGETRRSVEMCLLTAVGGCDAHRQSVGTSAARRRVTLASVQTGCRRIAPTSLFDSKASESQQVLRHREEGWVESAYDDAGWSLMSQQIRTRFVFESPSSSVMPAPGGVHKSAFLPLGTAEDPFLKHALKHA
ncbi:hypothetical protein Bbelb_103680 [Branchiostoma belcheri]|nr:hypothetical protein Bbelb_103680 [Branchiostoma belcheri]